MRLSATILISTICIVAGYTAGCQIPGRSVSLPDPARLPHTLEAGPIRQVFADPAAYASFPGWIRTSDELVIQFTVQDLKALEQSGVHPHYAPVAEDRFAISRDQGESWEITASPPRFGPVLHATRFMHSARAAMAGGELLTYFNGYDPVSRTRLEPRVDVHRGGLAEPPVVSVPIKSNDSDDQAAAFAMIRLPDNTFLHSEYLFGEQVSPGKPHGVIFRKGSADGKTWEELSRIPQQGEMLLTETETMAWEDGRVIALIRIDWDKTPADQLPPEANGNGLKRDGYGYFLYQAESGDFGRTWSEPKRLPVWGHPPNLLKLRSGNLLMVYGHRRPPWGVRAILSHDRGQTWDMDSMITLHTFEPGNYDLGYPVATQLEDGRIAVTFYGYSTAEVGKTASPHGIFCVTMEEK